jgi:hypothetical protein
MLARLAVSLGQRRAVAHANPAPTEMGEDATIVLDENCAVSETSPNLGQLLTHYRLCEYPAYLYPHAIPFENVIITKLEQRHHRTHY